MNWKPISSECRMAERQKRIRFYSDKHNRRLIQQQTEADIHRIFDVLENLPSSSIPAQTINPCGNEKLIHASDEVLERSDYGNVDHDILQLQDDIYEVLHNENNDSNCNSSIHSYEYPDFNSRDDDETDAPDIESTDDEAELSNDDEMMIDNDFVQDIATWMRQFKMSRESRVDLLRILNLHINVKFPKDPRKLLHTPTSTDVKEMCQGQYWHSGLRNAVKNILNKRQYLQLYLDNQTVNLFINVDGAPLGKSTQKCLWPILCSDDIIKEVDIVGIYYGEGKPSDPNKFLEPFINEAISLINEGIDFNNYKYKIRIKGLICDSPAKAYILMVKSHSGYDSCTKCYIHGDYIENTICFPGFCDVLRTDEMFKNFNYNLDYQNEETKLINIPYLGLVSNVPLDYMHLVCLGVMRKLIQLWLSGPINKNVRLPSNIVHEISNALTDLVKFIPLDFNRKPRALKYLKYWKATELRSFLLYLGPIVLRKHLRKDLYNHFLELHVAIIILASPVLSLNDVNVSYAEQLLNHFVSSFKILYGKRYISHNVHNLQHIAADVKKYGALDEFSAFRFENFIGILIKLVKKGEKPLQQISRRLKEYELTSQTKKKIPGNLIRLEQRHYNGIMPRNIFFLKQYKRMYKDDFYICITDNKSNCCLLDDGTIVEALNFVVYNNIQYLIGKELVKLKSLYEYPMSSSDFSIYVCKVNKVILSWLCSSIRAKLLKLPYNNKKADSIVVFPILHTTINTM